MIQFNATYLKHLLPFKGQQDIRYYLNAVHITPHANGGAVLVACNGTTMMCIRDVSAVCDTPATFRVHPDAARHSTKKRGQVDAIATIDTQAQRLTISNGEDLAELYLQPGKCLIEDTTGLVDGYVDWRKVMPTFAQLQQGGADAIDAKYYELAAKAHPGDKHSARAIRFWQVCPTAPLVVEFCGAPEYMLVIMPMRSTSHTPIDFWGKAFGKKQTAAAVPATNETALETA